MAMMEAVTSGVTSVIAWMGAVVDALVTTEGALNALLPLLAVGVAVSAFRFSIGGIRSLIWGA